MHAFHQILVFIWFVTLFIVTSLQPQCRLHHVENIEDLSLRTSVVSTNSLPIEATKQWLYPAVHEITSWYEKEKLNCESYMKRLLKQEKITAIKEISGINENENETIANKLTNCRGYKSLLRLTGKLVWPFGPYESCSTYSKCWFGLLTCGQTNISSIENIITPIIHSKIRDVISQKGTNIGISPIKFTQWSIRSLYFQIRFVGQEIIVPEVRYHFLEDRKDDVLIAQYSTTLNEVRDDEANIYPPSQLEIRHVDWYPALLHSYEPSNLLLQHPELLNAGRIFLGEESHVCNRKNICEAECDEVVQVVTTPLKVNIILDSPNHKPTCVLNKLESSLPICFVDKTLNSFHGRWIRAPFYASSTSPAAITAANQLAEIDVQQQKILDACDPTRTTIVKKKPTVTHYNAHTARLKNAKEKEVKSPSLLPCAEYAATNFTIISASTIATYCTHNTKYNILDLPYLHSALPSSDQLFTLSEKELSTKLALYNTRKALQPVAHRSNNNTNNHRRVVPIPRWQLWYEASGNPCIFDYNDKDDYNTGYWFYAPYQCKYHFYERSEIYQCFRSLHIHHIHIHGDAMARGIGYTLSRLLGISLLNETEYIRLKSKSRGELNGVIITEEEFTQSSSDDSFSFMKQQPQESSNPRPDVLITNQAFIHQYQSIQIPTTKDSSEHSINADSLPRYRFYQNTKAPHGPAAEKWNSNEIRQKNAQWEEYLVNTLGFQILDEYSLSAGRYEHRSQGWELENSVRQMEAMIVINMLCNQPWLSYHVPNITNNYV